MRETARVVALFSVALVPIACGGAPQSPQPQNPSPVAVGSDPVAVMADGAGNLAPAPEPADVVAVARWKSPRRVFDTFQQWVGLPIPINEGIEELFRVDGVASVIAMDAPVELLVALDPKATDRDPKPLVGFSVGMRSVEEARQAMQQDKELREVHEGVYRVEVGPRYDRMTCFLSASVGASSGRLVCGPRERDIEALYPYMTRSLPVATMPDTDLHGEIRLAPIQQKYGRMLPGAIEMGASVVSHEVGTGDRNLDRAITDTVSGLGQELLALSNDLDSLSFDVQLDPDGRTMTGDMSLAFKNKSSWLAQRMFDNANKAGPPPPIFWRAPSGSDNVFFDRGVDGKNYGAIKRHGTNLIDAALAHENFPAADRKAVVDLFERLFDGSPMSVSASGHIDSKASTTKGASEFDRIRDAASASLGWQLVGLEESPTRVDGWLRDLARAYSRPAVQRWIRDQSSLDVRSVPTMRYGAEAAAGLPGLKALKVTVPASAFDRSIKGRQPSPLIYYIMVLPDGARTWVAMGADKSALEKQLKAVKAGGSSTIEGRVGLESLKSGRAVSGGYVTIAGIAAQATSGLMDALKGGGYRDYQFEEVLNALARIPNHGETPIVVSSQVQEGSPAKVSVRFKVNRGTIDDLRSLIMAMGHRSSPGYPPPTP